MRRQFIATATILCLAGFICAGVAVAQGNLQLPGPDATGKTAWQFDVTGFIQAATLGGVGSPASPALAGGTITVNGHVITVPANTMVMFPANQLTWGEVFSQAPAPYLALGLSGLAMSDVPAPLTTYEAHVVGNVVTAGPAIAGGQYIAGLINISQHALNSGAGYITGIATVPGNCIAPATCGPEVEFQVATFNLANPVTRVRINDPKILGGNGRYTAGQSTDVRFTSDPDNPTIISGTGFPMCTYGNLANPAQCPEANRLKDALGNFLGSETTVTGNCTTSPCTLDALGNPIRILPGGGWPDATLMAPFEIGDYITFAGNLVLNCTVAVCNGGPTAMPVLGFPATLGVPTLNTTYISAHTITNNVAIFTAPRTASDPAPKDPAYAYVEVSLIGTGGLTVLGANEAVIRTRFEGMSTDPSRQVHLWGLDVPQPPLNPRSYGTIGVDQGPPFGAVKGRWRFRPPCDLFGTIPAKFDKACVMNQAGTFLPVTREILATIETPTCPAGGADPILGIACPALGAAPVPASHTLLGNGLIPGEYHAPIGAYIFAENIPGTPVPPADFNGVPFLAAGGYTSTLNTTAPGPLDPWPGTTVPAPVCVAPSANTNGPYQVVSGGVLTLFGTGGGTGTTYLWTAAQGSFGTPTALTTTFTAPLVAATTIVNVTLTATNACAGSPATSTTTITVNPLSVPTISYTPPNPIVSVVSGTLETLTASGHDPGNALKVDVTWTQTNVGAPGVPTVINPGGGGGSPAGTVLCKGTVAGGITTCTVSFTVNVPLGGAAVTILLAATSTDANGSSAPDTTSVTFNPPSSTIQITNAEYRTGKQRLIINATEQLASPTLNLWIQPYTAKDGVTLGCPYLVPNTPPQTSCQLTNNGGGLYISDVVGQPVPPCNGLPADNTSYATPCSVFPLDVKASDGGDSGFFRLTKIRQ